MRIALLHYSAPPIIGGVESVLGHHARLMSNAGHTVMILAGRGSTVDPQIPVKILPRLDSRHPQVMEFKTQLDRGQVPTEFESVRLEIQAELKSHLGQCDVLVIHNVASLHKNLALTAALHNLDQPKIILWHHDLAWTTPRYRAEVHDGYPWDLLRTAWAKATQVVVSAWRQTELAELFQIDPSLIRVIPIGVDLNTFHNLNSRTIELLTQIPVMGAAPLLLLPVRLTRRKNIELALRTLAELRRQFPEAQLLVTGPEGPHNPKNAAYKSELLTLRDQLGLQGHAHFLAEITSEFLPDSVIADFYRLADALILPSREEGFGIPIIEAGFAHLPVFCTNIPVLHELGGDVVTYFDPDADPSFVAQLIGAELSRNQAYQWALRARQGYAWDNIYAQHIEPLLQETQQ